MAKCVQCAKNLLPNRQKQTENTTENINVVLCSYCGCAQDLPSAELADETHGENRENRENREDGLEQDVLEALFEQDDKDKTSAISRIHVVAFWVLWLGVGVIALLVWNHA